MDGRAHIPSLEELLGEERWLHALARRLVRDASTAEDLAQETWLRALRARHEAPAGASGRRAGDPRAWLGRVLRNVWRERGRSERARLGRERAAAAREALPSARESLERIELAQRLARRVLELDEPFRSTVILRYYEGRGAAEIATRLGEPADRVRWRLMRARELLRTRLEREDAGWVRAFALFLPLSRRATRPPWLATGGGGLGGLAMGSKGLAAVCVGAGLLATWALLMRGDPDERGEELVELAAVASAAEGPVSAPPTPAGRVEPPAPASTDGVAETAGATSETTTARLGGTVRAAEDARPLAGVEVGLFEVGLSRMRASAHTGGDGTFELVDLEPGRYDLVARLDGRRPARLPSLELVDGERQQDLELASGSVAEVEVVARDGGGPIPEARVRWIAGDADTVTWYRDDALRFVTLSGATGPDGRARLAGAAPGTYQVVVQAEGWASSLSQTLFRPESEPLRIELARGALVAGTVTAADGAPVEGARVFLNPAVYEKGRTDLADHPNGGATDRDGRYRLEGVPQGLYHAVALRPDGSGAFLLGEGAWEERSLRPVPIENGAEITLDFHLPRPGSVRGRVVDEQGQPVAGASVSVSWGDFKSPRAGFFPLSSVPGVKESIHHATRTDADGAFALDTLRASWRALEIKARCAGYLEDEQALEVEPGARLEPVFTLARLGAEIRGRLLDERGEPVAGQSVGAFEVGLEGGSERLGNFYQAKSAADGSYALVVPGTSTARHRVQPILRDGDPLASEPVRREGVPVGATGVDFVLRTKRLVHGRVVDEQGAPVREFVVHALEAGAGSEPRWDERRDVNLGEGRFELFVDPVQTSVLRFTSPGFDPAALGDLGRDEARRVELRQAPDLLGTVVDDSGRGVPDVVVALATLDSAIYPRGTAFAPRDRTDAAGRFRLRAVPDLTAVPGPRPLAGYGTLLVCPGRADAPALLHVPVPEPRSAPLRIVLPRSIEVELEFADPHGEAIEGTVVVLDSAGWPMEPAAEGHLSDLIDGTRGVLVAGRARFRLLPGAHHAILVQDAAMKETFPFEVEAAGDDALQSRVFRVTGSR